jgi:hypothetical protein
MHKKQQQKPWPQVFVRYQSEFTHESVQAANTIIDRESQINHVGGPILIGAGFILVFLSFF